MQYSTNYNLNLIEGTDIVNPLVIDKPNYQTIDAAMKANKDAAVNAASHTKAGTVHAIVRTNTDANVFRFVASAPFTAGDTFTVDGNAVTGINTAGEGLETNDFVIGDSVLCVLNSGTLTLNVNKKVTIPATYDADDIVFDNTGTGISATDVQGAIEEVNGKFLIVSDRYNITPQAVAPQTQPFIQVDITRAGYNAVGIIACVTYDSSLNLLPLSITGFSCNPTTAYIELFNSATGTQTITSVGLTILYAKS